MVNPNGKTWQKPQELSLVRSSEPKSFEEALELFTKQAQSSLDFHRDVEKCRVYLAGVITERTVEQITKELCSKILRENDFVRKVFDISIIKDKPFTNSDLGKIGAYLIAWINENNK
jgi:hypothetical protein